MEKAESTGEPESIVSPLSFKLLLECPLGLSPDQVSVDFNPSHDRQPHPNIILENSISEVWNRRIQETPSLFNGTKFRYDGYAMHSFEDSNQKPNVCLHLGLTDYRTFMGTNLSTVWDKFIVPSEGDPERCQHTSSPLGNGAIVETTDKKIIILQRSNNVGEFPGYFVFPGGHPEPQETGILAHGHDQDVPVSKQINEKVSKEMFDSIVREVVEEIGVPVSSLGDPIFIGISRRELNVRPAAFFFLKCSLESKEIQQLYSKAQDGYESIQIYTLSRNELEKISTKMPGCHRGGLALYELMVDAGHLIKERGRQ